MKKIMRHFVAPAILHVEYGIHKLSYCVRLALLFGIHFKRIVRKRVPYNIGSFAIVDVKVTSLACLLLLSKPFYLIPL